VYANTEWRDRARRKEATPEHIVWIAQFRREHEAEVPSFELKEGPDPLHSILEDGIDEERHEKSQLKNGFAYEKKVTIARQARR
jgi:hypothetical protein